MKNVIANADNNPHWTGALVKMSVLGVEDIPEVVYKSTMPTSEQSTPMTLHDKLVEIDHIEQDLNLAGFRFAVRNDELASGEKLTTDKVIDFVYFAANRVRELSKGKVEIAKAELNPPEVG
ncbi:hypothetical protein [Rhodopirellula europaea]|uniref:hypothetical protein n=1 Tax=Rhodopirellula europaea TaxID=1263866 RepID=UPI003D2E87D5